MAKIALAFAKPCGLPVPSSITLFLDRRSSWHAWQATNFFSVGLGVEQRLALLVPTFQALAIPLHDPIIPKTIIWDDLMFHHWKPKLSSISSIKLVFTPATELIASSDLSQDPSLGCTMSPAIRGSNIRKKHVETHFSLSFSLSLWAEGAHGIGEPSTGPFLFKSLFSIHVYHNNPYKMRVTCVSLRFRAGMKEVTPWKGHLSLEKVT